MGLKDPIIFYMGMLLSISLLLFYIWSARRRRQLMYKFASREIIDKINPMENTRYTLFQPYMNAFMVFLLFLALAGPEWGEYWKEKRSKGTDVLFCVDLSNSMKGVDVLPSRIQLTKHNIKEFVKRLKGDRVGLIGFAGDAFIFCPLTSDYDGFFLMLDNMKVGSVERGGTSIPAAMDEVVRAFKWTETDQRIMLLISDGENTEGDVESAIKEIVKNKVKIYSIGVGSKEGARVYKADKNGNAVPVKDENGKPVISRLDVDLLKNISTETNGAYLGVLGRDNVFSLFHERYLKLLEKKESEEKPERVPKDRFQLPLFLFLAVIIMSIFFERYCRS